MNKVILMGRLTKAPELRYTRVSNTATCTFTLAINRRFSKLGEEKQADFIPIVTYGKTAEFCSKWFSKGRQVSIVGWIRQRKWDDDDGKRHYITEVIADEAYFADSKSEKTGDAFDQGNVQQGFSPIEEDDDLPF